MSSRRGCGGRPFKDGDVIDQLQYRSPRQSEKKPTRRLADRLEALSFRRG